MSIFSEAWRACLRAQYKYVFRTNDRVTENSLTSIMLDVGFTEDELARLRVEATMHVDDLPDGFVPDLDILNQDDAPSQVKAPIPPEAFQPHPLECQCPACMEMHLTPHDEEGQPIMPDKESRDAGSVEEDEDPDSPQQLTMF
jgi:hypothetical protein